VRTVWVDALCINQGDDGEKRHQVQRMDLVYANAGGVRVWLGGYHDGSGSGAASGSCSAEGDVECEHQRGIRDAFDVIWRLSSWRLLVAFWVARDKKERIERARAGFTEIFGRGWWERLWVIQEVALATGPVSIQCGHYTCDFDELRSAKYPVLEHFRAVKEMKDGAAPMERLGEVVKEFRYSSFHDRGNAGAELISLAMMNIIGFLFPFTKENKANFHKQPFADRLQRILLRTAGHFLCRDDRDRLYAVLGIAGGAKKGDVTYMADFVRYISSFSTGQIIAHTMDPFLKARPNDHALKIGAISFALAHSSWAWFYDSRAKHWTINRPDYVVTGYREAIDAVAGGSEASSGASRVAFFTALARYLASQTKTLGFLDAASCGEDNDRAMPSWVPNWKREASPQAYEFTSRKKDGLARDSFGFEQDGKTLWLVGRPRGTVHVVRSADEPVSAFQAVIEHWLALPREGKEGIVSTFQLISDVIRISPEGELSKGTLGVLSTLFKAIQTFLKIGEVWLRHGLSHERTLLYSFDKRSREVGFLRAGEAAVGDRIVFVPGCFHHLVLRRQREAKTKVIPWRLVGLVAMGTDEKKRGGCPASEWAQLRKDGATFKYHIV
jgi:hypothetical protein